MKQFAFLFTLCVSILWHTVAVGCDITRTTGVPSTNTTLVNICHDSIQIGWNPLTRSPAWVQQKVTFELSNGTLPRMPAFMVDPLLTKSYQVRSEEFIGARNNRGEQLVRGHLAPADDFSGSRIAKYESFYMTNVIPQVQQCNNNGLWKSIESYVQSIGKANRNVVAVSGPLYLENYGIIGRGIPVPSHIFKIMLVGNNTVAWMVPNTAICGRSPEKYYVSKNYLESIARMQFFPKFTTKDMYPVMKQ